MQQLEDKITLPRAKMLGMALLFAQDPLFWLSSVVVEVIYSSHYAKTQNIVCSAVPVFEPARLSLQHVTHIRRMSRVRENRVPQDLNWNTHAHR